MTNKAERYDRRWLIRSARLFLRQMETGEVAFGNNGTVKEFLAVFNKWFPSVHNERMVTFE